MRGHALFPVGHAVITSERWASGYGVDLSRQPVLLEYRGGSEHVHVNSCYLQGEVTGGEVQPELQRCIITLSVPPQTPTSTMFKDSAKTDA